MVPKCDHVIAGNLMDVDSPLVYQQKGERGKFPVKLFHDKELDLCNWGGEDPKSPSNHR